MKKEINKKLKFGLVAIILILLGLISFLLYRELTQSTFKENKKALYAYKRSAEVNYKVFLKPNILYDKDNLGENKAYISPLIQSIKTYFSYKFMGEEMASIKGEYQIYALMEGYVEDGEKQETIWKKQFPLIPKTTFQSEEKGIVIGKDVVLDFQAYTDFANSITQVTQIGSQIKMTVTMDVKMEAQTDQGIIEQKSSPSIVFPLNVNSFKVTKQQTGDKAGAIEKTEKIKIPINKTVVIIYSVILGILIILLLFIAFFIKGVLKDPLAKQLDQIFKTHGDRLVALDREMQTKLENPYYVRTIEDLVRVSDELGKPIIYNFSEDYKNITKFYVFDNNCVYILELDRPMQKLKWEPFQEKPNQTTSV